MGLGQYFSDTYLELGNQHGIVLLQRPASIATRHSSSSSASATAAASSPLLRTILHARRLHARVGAERSVGTSAIAHLLLLLLLVGELLLLGIVLLLLLLLLVELLLLLRRQTLSRLRELWGVA